MEIASCCAECPSLLRVPPMEGIQVRLVVPADLDLLETLPTPSISVSRRHPTDRMMTEVRLLPREQRDYWEGT